MSTTLNAFRDYRCGKNADGTEFIEYLENDDFDLSATTWSRYICPILTMASELSGSNIEINVYDKYDSVELAKSRDLQLIDPEVFTIALEDVKAELIKKEDDDSKQMVHYVDRVLLPRTKRGLYLTQNRE